MPYLRDFYQTQSKCLAPVKVSNISQQNIFHIFSQNYLLFYSDKISLEEREMNVRLSAYLGHFLSDTEQFP